MKDETQNTLLDITPADIETAFQAVSIDLNDKIYLFTYGYWKYIYIDRFLKIMILISSMVSFMILLIKLFSVNLQIVSDIGVYVIFIFSSINLLNILLLLFFKVRSKCVYYNTISKLYYNISMNLKKILVNPMNKTECDCVYKNIINQINLVEQFESTYKIV
jgi:hypothetical protein